MTASIVTMRHTSQHAEMLQRHKDEVGVTDRIETELEDLEAALERIVQKLGTDPYEEDLANRFAAEIRSRAYWFVQNLARTGDEPPF